MLSFSKPHSIDASIEETYRYLLGQLQSLIGFPVKLTRGLPAPAVAPNRPVLTSDGGLELYLPSIVGRETHWKIAVGTEAAQDKLCRQLLSRFVQRARRFVADLKKSWDIKAKLVRDGVLFWDEVLLSLTLSGAQKYNALEMAERYARIPLIPL